MRLGEPAAPNTMDTLDHAILEADADAAEMLTPFAGGEAVIRILRCPDKPGANEDAVAGVALGRGEGVLVVADGAGGHAGAAEAASIAVRTVADAVRRAYADGTETRAAILRAIDEANHAVLDLRNGAACTLAVAEIDGQWVQAYHVGDAQVLVVGQRGRVRHQSIAHSPVGYAVHAGLLDEPEAIHHAERHVVTNAVGMDDMRIEIGPVLRLAARDTLLVSSDGIFDNLYLAEIVDLIRTGPISEAADRLMLAARARMLEADGEHPSKPDDIGFALFRPTGR